MTTESDEEMAYNQEVDRLVVEGMSCPKCNKPPTTVERVVAGFGAMAVCPEGHHYYIRPDGDEEFLHGHRR